MKIHIASFCKYRSRNYLKQKKQKTENKTTPNKDLFQVTKQKCLPVPAERPYIYISWNVTRGFACLEFCFALYDMLKNARILIGSHL